MWRTPGLSSQQEERSADGGAEVGGAAGEAADREELTESTKLSQAEESAAPPAQPESWREGEHYDYPTLIIRAAVEEWREEERLLLSFATPALGTFEMAGRKSLYMLSVKVCHARAFVRGSSLQVD
ncbi:deleted in malignant brain tumors 1 protein-like [Tachysurus ichikawai]